MRVTHLGHAGLKVETAGGTVLIDPWFSPEGAFQASWFQYPDNAHLLTPDLFRPTAIVISHEHLDHVDAWFLSRVPPNVPVIIHRYPSPVLRRKVLAGGPREVISADAWDRVDVAGGRVFFVQEESPANHDAAIVLEGDGQVILDLNDARLSPVQFREIRARVGGAIHLFPLQAAGASWYPMCYDYSDERRRDLSRRKRIAKFTYVARAIKIVEPVVALPFAGPPCFLDPDLFRHNAEIDDGIFPDQQQAADWLAGRGIMNTVVLLPGDAWDIDTQKKQTDPVWGAFSFDDRWPYLEAYQRRRQTAVDAVLAKHPYPVGSMWGAFRDYFDHLLTLRPYFNRKINMRVGFEITGPGGGMWAVDFRPGHEGVYDNLGDYQYRYRFASRWLQPLLNGNVPWEDFFLSLRFEAWRDPDLYNDHLLGLLKFAHPEALEAVERFETSMSIEERIIVHAGGSAYRIQRRCPHAGNDLLETGEILPGRIIRCLAHHYEFSLDTGDCINGGCPPLATERVTGGAAGGRPVAE